MPSPSILSQLDAREDTLHDYPIHDLSAIAESLGYTVVQQHFGIEKGPDLVLENPITMKKVIIESEIGHNITNKTYEKFEKEASELLSRPDYSALVVITETPRRAWTHRYNSKALRPKENYFVVAGSVFKDLMPALLVKILK